MNSTTQLDLHPDAESLSAFAEQALPERERGQIVAHLAECSRCRQVIFLAQQADPQMEMAVPAAHSAGRSWHWLSDWRLAWIPAAALATVVGLALLVHGRREETGTEMARVVPQAVPQNDESVAKPAAKERVFARKEHAPVSSVSEKQAENKVEPASVEAAFAPAPAEAAPTSAAATETVTVTAAPPLLQSENASVGQVVNTDQINATPLNGRNWVYIAQLTAGQNKSAAPSAPQPATGGMRQRVAGANSSNAGADHTATAKMDGMADRSQASRKAETRYAGSGGTSTSQLKKEGLSSGSYVAGAPMPATQFEAARETNAAPAQLPSGLNIVSSVTAENRTLAVDQAGALFLSRDSGSNWESVARQWTGRAVDVSLHPSLNGGLFVAAPASAAAPPAAQPKIFELRNDKNLVWVSTDGVNWTEQ